MTEVRASKLQTDRKRVCLDDQQNSIRCEDSKEGYERLTQLIKENVPTGPDAFSWRDPQADALDRIKRLKPGTPLVDEETMLNFWSSLRPIASGKDSAYEVSLAKLLIESSCAAEGAPYVAAKVLQSFGSGRPFSKDSSQPRLIAEALLDKQRCPGSVLLSDDQNAQLHRLRDGAWLYPDSVD